MVHLRERAVIGVQEYHCTPPLIVWSGFILQRLIEEALFLAALIYLAYLWELGWNLPY